MINFSFFLFSLPNPVQLWLHELSTVHEAECTIMLQSKPIPTTPPSSSNLEVKSLLTGATGGPGISAVEVGGGFWAGSSKDTIRAIQSKAHAISAVFVKLCK